MNWRGALRWGALALLLLALVLVPFALFGESLEGWLQALMATRPGSAVVAAVVVVALAADVILPVPSSVLATGAGALLGFWGGTAVNFVGLSLGAAAGYAIGTSGRGLAERVVGRQRLDSIETIVARRGDMMLAAMRPIPVMAEVSVVVAGIARMSVRRFAVFVGLANLGVAAAYALIGFWAVSTHALAVAGLASLLVPGVAMLVGAALRSQPEPGSSGPTEL